MTTLWNNDIGRIFLPEATVSYPSGGQCRPQSAGIMVAVQKRLPAKMRGYLDIPDIEHPIDPAGETEAALAPYRRELNPQLFTPETIWASVQHNERVDKGAAMQFFRFLATTGTGYTAAGGATGPTVVAIASATLATPLATHLSLGSASADVTTNEFTTIGLSRTATGMVVGVYTAPASLDATASCVIQKNGNNGITVFSVTGTGTAFGSGLFDNTTVVGSNLYVEKNFAEGSASVVNTDSLAVSWTITM